MKSVPGAIGVYVGPITVTFARIRANGEGES